MTASVGNIVLYILFLWIAPVFVGNAICNRLSMRGTIPRSFVMGYLSMWAVFQIITVPLILLKVSFFVFGFMYVLDVDLKRLVSMRCSSCCQQRFLAMVATPA